MLSNFESFRIEHCGAVCVVRALGDVDLANCNDLEQAMRCASVESAAPVIVSFADCTFADCSCLNVLIRTSKTLGDRLHIVAPPKSCLRRVLDLTRMNGVFRVHDEIGTALGVAGTLGAARAANRGVRERAQRPQPYQVP